MDGVIYPGSTLLTRMLLVQVRHERGRLKERTHATMSLRVRRPVACRWCSFAPTMQRGTNIEQA